MTEAAMVFSPAEWVALRSALDVVGERLDARKKRGDGDSGGRGN